jgi:hypothetical protein
MLARSAIIDARLAYRRNHKQGLLAAAAERRLAVEQCARLAWFCGPRS